MIIVNTFLGNSEDFSWICKKVESTVLARRETGFSGSELSLQKAFS